MKFSGIYEAVFLAKLKASGF